MERLPVVARFGFAIAVAGSGVMQVINAEIVRLVPPLPAWLPAHPVWAVGGGLALLLIGVALFADCRQRVAALVLAALLAGVLLLRVPEIAANPGAGFVWTNPVKVLALLGGALLVAGEAGWVRLAAAGLLAVFLLICGAQHFAYAGFVDTLVPAWIPPSQRFWTYFSAVALLAGGLGVMLPPTRRLAGILSGIMIFLWVLLLHIPRSVEMKSASELAGVFEALGLAGVAWLVAGSRPRTREKRSA